MNKTNISLFGRLACALCLTLAATGAAYCQFDLGGDGGAGGSGSRGGGRGGFGGFGGADEKPAWKQFNLNPKSRMKLDFRNASVDAILRLYSETSGIPIIKDPSLTGGLTLQSPKQETLGNAFAQLNAVLGLRNYEIAKDGNFLVVRPKQGGFGGFRGFGRGEDGDRGRGGLQLKVYPIKYANATQVARVVNEVFAIPPQLLQAQAGQPGQQPGQAQPQGGNNPFAFGRRNRGGGGGGGGARANFAAGAAAFGAEGVSIVKASADDYSNSVIVNANSRDQTQVEEIIRQLDKVTEQPQQSRVYPLVYAAAQELAPVVQNVLVSNAPRGRGGAGQQNVPIEQRFQAAFRFGNTQAAFGNVVADARTNSLVVTATGDNLDTIGKLIQQLDKPVSYEDTAFVVTLQNARADDVAQLINATFGSRTGGGAGNLGRTNNTRRLTGSAGGGARPAALNRGGGNNGRAVPAPAGGSAGVAPTRAAIVPDASGTPEEIEIALANPDAGGGDLATNVTVQQGFPFRQFGGGQRGGFGGGGGGTAQDANGRVTNLRDLTGDVQVIPDINTNSVIIVTSPGNRGLLQQIVDQLDRIPEQVMIETVIVEASLDASKKLGIEWSITQNSIFGDNKVKGAGTQQFGVQADTAQPQGIRYTLTGPQYTAFLQAVQSDSRFDVLSTPRIFTSNNATAEINISQSLPYVTNTVVNANGINTFSYDFLDVGIVLNVTPRITSNGYVTMDVTQTANDFVGYTTFNAPIVNQREAQTTVSVRDGETVVLGGVIRNSVQTTVNKLPILGDLPLLGKLFQSTSTDRNKTELLVFLTPRVVRDAEQARRLREATEKQLQKGAEERLNEYRKTAPVLTAPPNRPFPPVVPGAPPSAPPATIPPSTPVPSGTPPRNPQSAPGVPVINPPATAPATPPANPAGTPATNPAAPATNPAAPGTTPATNPAGS